MQKVLSIVLLGFCGYLTILYWIQQKTKWDKNHFFISISYLMLLVWSLICCYSFFMFSHNLFFLDAFKKYQILISAMILIMVGLYFNENGKNIRPLFVIILLFLFFFISMLVPEHSSVFQFLVFNICGFYVYKKYEKYGLVSRNFLSFCFLELMAMTSLLVLDESISYSIFFLISIASKFYLFHFMNQIRARIKFREICE